jgi:pimeloyl-ACP methyl ester carboxylesterase
MDDVSQSNHTVVAFNGATLHYDDAGSGLPIILLHAGIADQRMWDNVIGPLSEQYRVIRHDLRGWGDSTTEDVPFAHHEDLAALITALDAAPAWLIGASFGGRVAIDCVLAHPEVVAGLVLVGAALGGYPWPESLNASEEEIEAAFNAGDFDRAAEVDTRVWVDGPNRSREDVDPQVRERAKEMARHVYEVATDAGQPVPLDPPAIERLAEIDAPTLIIVGDQDQPMILEIADRLARDIRGSHLETIHDAAHLPSMEAPKAFHDLVVGYIDAARSAQPDD